MNLKSFKVRSYRSCQNTEFSMSENLTGLIGINGSGKSNVLNALLLLRKICEGRYLGMRSNEPTLNICHIGATIEHENNAIQLKGKIGLETDDRNNDEIIFSRLEWKFSNFRKGEWFSIPLEWILFRNPEFPSHLPRRFRGQMPAPGRLGQNDIKFLRLLNDKNFKQKVEPLLNKILLFFTKISYYSATQFADPVRCPVSIELEEDRPRRRMRSSSGHEQFIFDLYNSKKENENEYQRYFNTVSKEGIGLIDGLEFKNLPIPSSVYKVQSGGRIRQIDSKRFLIVPIFTIDGRELSPNQLSEGTFKTLALLYYIITDKSNLLLIEEPEVCVHHGLLDSIINLIIDQSKQKQIIISTHSDLVLDHLRPESILLVSYLKSKGTMVKQLKKSMSESNYGALKNYLKESGNLGEYWREGGLDHD